MCFHRLWHSQLGFSLVVINLWLCVGCSAWLPCPDTEFGEKDKPIRRQTSQSYNEVSCWFCAAQQRANPVWPRVYPGNYWLEFIMCIGCQLFPVFCRFVILIRFVCVYRWPDKLPVTTGAMRYQLKSILWQNQSLKSDCTVEVNKYLYACI